MTQLSFFPEYRPLANPQPNDSIVIGEEITAMSSDMGWIRVEAIDTNPIQTFRVNGGTYDGAIITRDFLWIL